MPKGFHYGRPQTRSYTGRYQRICAKRFKCLLDSPTGNYEMSGTGFSEEHCKFSLIECKEWYRVMVFTINERQVPVPLQTDNSSASNKLYLICPCCQKQRQHLYVLKALFACRECAGLHYGCQSERKLERLSRRIRKQRAKLWTNDIFGNNDLFEKSYWWPKPKGLHESTFQRKRNELIQLESEYWKLARKQLEMILR